MSAGAHARDGVAAGGAAAGTADRALRVGLMVPANNTTMARELPAWLPGGSSADTRKVPRGPGLLTRESVPAYVDAAIEVARGFADAPPDLVAYGCTAAGFLMGPEADAALAARLHAVTGRPVVTAAGAMVEVLRREGASRVAVVTPYTEEVNRQLVDYLERSGIGVARLETLGATDTASLGRITAPEVDALARATVDDSHDALFIACAQLPAFEILDALRADLAALTIHAGEFAGADSVDRTLALAPQAIGHGVRSLDDPAVVERLVASGVTLEVCPTSNRLLIPSAVDALVAAHHAAPLVALQRAGVRCVLGSDDPEPLATSYQRERAIAGELGVELAQLDADAAARWRALARA